MRSYFFLICLSFCFSFANAKLPSFLESSPLTINLKDPEYKNSTISTVAGGVIYSDSFHLQAMNISYVKKTSSSEEVHKVIASGQLMLSINGQIFLGEHLEYDFINKEGVLEKGRTTISPWFISGDEIILHADKSFSVTKSSVTTAETKPFSFEMCAENIHLSNDKHLSSKNIKFKTYNIPIFWIPKFNANLKLFSDHPVRYTLTWDTGQGPRIGMRYRIYSWEELNMYLRVDYRYAKGPGFAFEADYLSKDKRKKLFSKNYFANDTFYNDDNPNKKKKRFRLQGLYEAKTENNSAEVLVTYDRISDKNMVSDFKSDDFELDTAKRTRATARYFSNGFLTGFNVEPRINSFQGFKQELPKFNLYIPPVKIPKTSLLVENHFDLSYLDYTYSDDIQRNTPQQFLDVLDNFHSIRLASINKLVLPLFFKGLRFVSNASFHGILYSDSPESSSVFQSVFSYTSKLSCPLQKNYSSITHKASPYASIEGYSDPVQGSKRVFIFDIHDGYHRLNMIKCGIDNLFYSINHKAEYTFNLYTLGFLGDKTYNLAFPKAGIDFIAKTSIVDFYSYIRWNFDEKALDYGNFRLLYTLSSNLALSLEYRHRSKYDWRKAVKDNYIIDSSRSFEDLLDSPLSDGRNTFLSTLELKLTPTTKIQLQTHQGWGRKNQPSYFESKLDFLTLVASNWRLKVSYMHTTRADQVSFGLDLIKS